MHVGHEQIGRRRIAGQPEIEQGPTVPWRLVDGLVERLDELRRLHRVGQRCQEAQLRFDAFDLLDRQARLSREADEMEFAAERRIASVASSRGCSRTW